MSDLDHSGMSAGPPEGQGYDRDINLKGVFVFAGGVIASILVAAVAMWSMSVLLRGRLTDADPAPAVIPEARQAYEPPGPRLQDDPEHELEVLRAEEDQILESYRWLDEAGEVAQIPVERAVAILAAEAAVAPSPVVEEVAGESLAPSPEDEPVGEGLAPSDEGEAE